MFHTYFIDAIVEPPNDIKKFKKCRSSRRFIPKQTLMPKLQF